jgi:hypothetical protein
MKFLFVWLLIIIPGWNLVFLLHHRTRVVMPLSCSSDLMPIPCCSIDGTLIKSKYSSSIITPELVHIRPLLGAAVPIENQDSPNFNSTSTALLIRTVGLCIFLRQPSTAVCDIAMKKTVVMILALVAREL